MNMTPFVHLECVYELLVETYGTPKNAPDYDPLGGLVGTILSQHTSDINSHRAYTQLVETYPTWEQVRDAQTQDVANAIRSGGLAAIKAPRIQDALLKLTEEQQAQNGNKPLATYFYDELKKRSSEDALAYLRNIPGVGPKTAACVLMFHLDQPVIPIDTHVFRCLNRLGIIGPKVNVEKAHVIISRVIPPEWVYPLHVNLIHHGKRVCHSQRPACESCTLHAECAYVGSINAQETSFMS